MENQQQFEGQQIQQQQIQKNNQRGKKSTLLLVLLLLLVTVTIGYAVLSTTLKINGVSTVTDATWDVEIPADDPTVITCPAGEICTINPDNPEELTPQVCVEGDTIDTCRGAIIWLDGDTVYFKHILTKPGDTFTFNTKFANNGTIDAKIKNVSMPTFNQTQKDFTTYSVTYSDGSAVGEGDVLAAGSSATFKVTVSYKNVDALPTAEQLALINNGTLQGQTGMVSLFSVNYEQK